MQKYYFVITCNKRGADDFVVNGEASAPKLTMGLIRELQEGAIAKFDLIGAIVTFITPLEDEDNG